jgi:hypothetical protein
VYLAQLMQSPLMAHWQQLQISGWQLMLALLF